MIVYDINYGKIINSISNRRFIPAHHEDYIRF